MQIHRLLSLQSSFQACTKRITFYQSSKGWANTTFDGAIDSDQEMTSTATTQLSSKEQCDIFVQGESASQPRVVLGCVLGCTWGMRDRQLCGFHVFEATKLPRLSSLQ